ncbi:hypothetical protein [Mesorhizobium sp. AR10]|uniref:hypothetical protein n=1 Tax=Mesorhizobium sp. AR10 TaxID=2865839 RepID=UPI002160CFDB|nr:hypothetical protein [Mesorhizobium sp. AR10]
MEPRRKPRTNDEVEAPAPEQQDWPATERDPIRGAKILPDSVPEDEGADIDEDGELPDEDDDNAYQNSDEALPDDAEEAAIARDPARRGRPFDEV